MRKLTLFTASALLGLGLAQAALADIGPTVQITPNPNKPPEVFADDQMACRHYADRSIRYNEGPNGAQTVGGAVTGGVVGAAVGGATTGRRSGVGIGAIIGAVAGAAIGSSTEERERHALQARYDDAYEDCMVGRGNLGPGQAHLRPAAPPPPPSGGDYPPPPPPSGSPQHPPATPQGY